MKAVIERLLKSSEPSIRLRTRTNILGESSASPLIRALGEEVRCSERVKILLSERDENGVFPYHPYSKWSGAH